MRDGQQIGRATTTAWSPTLKRLIALATIDAPFFAQGTRVEMELTVEAMRHFVGATVVQTPFFNPSRKTATPPVRRPAYGLRRCPPSGGPTRSPRRR